MILTEQNGAVAFAGRRVSRRHPCPICGKDSWCLVDPDRGLALCPRTEGGRKIGSAGWLHSLDGAPSPIIKFDGTRKHEEPPEMAEAGQMQARFQRQGAPRLGLLAMSLGLSLRSLERLGAGWNGSAWTFPMRNSRGEIVGFRTRLENGRKLAIKGSRSGLFIPSGVRRTAGGVVWVVEGPTDCAAMLDLGFDAIGRPACRGSEQEIRRWTTGMDVVVVADRDESGVGEAGARDLIRTLRGSAQRVRMILPPFGMKDARMSINHGGSRSDWTRLLGDSGSRRSSIGPQA